MTSTASGTATTGDQRAENAAHTPGPWVVSRMGGKAVYADVPAPSKHKIAICEHVADARLIAAAPDMLAALQDAINWFSPPNDSGPFPAKQIAAAIAKATGHP